LTFLLKWVKIKGKRGEKMNIIDLETPINSKIFYGPKTAEKEPFYIPEYGITYRNTPCYQLRMESKISCIQYVLSGSGILLYDGKMYTVKEGDSFILLAGRDQIYYSNPDNQFERIWINFRGELSLQLIFAYGLQEAVVFQNTNILPFLEKIHKVCEKNQDPEIYKEKSAVEFLKLIQFFARNKENTAASSTPLEEVRQYLDFHIMENITLNHVAKKFSFSKEHLIRSFKKSYGITPYQYLLQSRLRIAMIMLKTTDDSLSEIAEKLNFSDPHHFSDTFKKHLGFRPSEYRRESGE